MFAKINCDLEWGLRIMRVVKVLECWVGGFKEAFATELYIIIMGVSKEATNGFHAAENPRSNWKWFIRNEQG